MPYFFLKGKKMQKESIAPFLRLWSTLRSTNNLTKSNFANLTEFNQKESDKKTPTDLHSKQHVWPWLPPNGESMFQMSINSIPFLFNYITK